MSVLRNVFRRVTGPKKVELDTTDTYFQFSGAFLMPPSKVESILCPVDPSSSESDDSDDVPWVREVIVDEPAHCDKPKMPSFEGFMQLPTDVLENIISNFDTCTLHAFRQSSPETAKLAEFRGIQCHKLIVDRYMRPGAMHSVERKGKIITTASIDAVLNTERVKVRYMLQIGDIHPSEVTAIVSHIDSRYTSIVFEGPVNHRIFYALFARDKTITMDLKAGITLPKTHSSRFWSYFSDQTILEVRKSFFSKHLFVKATYDSSTDDYAIRVVSGY